MAEFPQVMARTFRTIRLAGRACKVHVHLLSFGVPAYGYVAAGPCGFGRDGRRWLHLPPWQRLRAPRSHASRAHGHGGGACRWPFMPSKRENGPAHREKSHARGARGNPRAARAAAGARRRHLARKCCRHGCCLGGYQDRTIRSEIEIIGRQNVLSYGASAFFGLVRQLFLCVRERGHFMHVFACFNRVHAHHFASSLPIHKLCSLVFGRFMHKTKKFDYFVNWGCN